MPRRKKASAPEAKRGEFRPWLAAGVAVIVGTSGRGGRERAGTALEKAEEGGEAQGGDGDDPEEPGLAGEPQEGAQDQRGERAAEEGHRQDGGGHAGVLAQDACGPD